MKWSQRLRSKPRVQPIGVWRSTWLRALRERRIPYAECRMPWKPTFVAVPQGESGADDRRQLEGHSGVERRRRLKVKLLRVEAVQRRVYRKSENFFPSSAAFTASCWLLLEATHTLRLGSCIRPIRTGWLLPVLASASGIARLFLGGLPPKPLGSLRSNGSGPCFCKGDLACAMVASSGASPGVWGAPP